MNEKNLKKQSETDWARIDRMTDKEIDTSDSPPLDGDFFARAEWQMPEKKTRLLWVLIPKFWNGLKHKVRIFNIVSMRR